jgi:glycine betaine transporter
LDDSKAAANERLLSFLTQDELERLRPQYVVRVGMPAEEVVRYADVCDADLIIMGTHGRSGIAHALMGAWRSRSCETHRARSF